MPYFSKKTRFLTTRKSKKPGFWEFLRNVTKFSREKPGFSPPTHYSLKVFH